MRKRLLIIAAFLVAGAAVNVAVAWVLAVRIGPVHPSAAVSPREGIYEVVENSQWWWCQVLVRPGHAQVVWERPNVVKAPVALSGETVVEISARLNSRLQFDWFSRRCEEWLRSQGVDPKGPINWRPQLVSELERFLMELRPERVERDALPSWGDPPEDIQEDGRVRCAFGWPRVAIWHENLLNLGSREQVITDGGLSLPKAFQSLGSGHVLPYRIIVAGFVINTLFYGAVLALLIIGPYVLRRQIRTRRGLCPGCAYPVRDSAVCTECGTLLPKRGVDGGPGYASEAPGREARIVDEANPLPLTYADSNV